MKKIEMVDLKGQYNHIKEQVNQSVLETIESTMFINGPKVKSFQDHLEKYLDVKHVIPCANGTDALQIALMGLGLKPGDEVITADFTFAATVEVISLLGLTPVLVDVDPKTFNIDLPAIEKVIGPKTKAIIPVHLFGQAADMEEILALANKYNLYVVEDNAQSIGANYTFSDGSKKKTGTLGHVGTTSFFPSKNLGAYGDGGAIFTNDDQLAHTIRGMVNHGMYIRYQHDVVGVNSRLDSVQAAILDIKLNYLDFYNESRKASALKYNQRLADHPNLITPFRKGDCDTHVYHQYTLKVIDGDRDGLVQHLNEKGIPCGVYYPIPLHLQKAYTSDHYNADDFKVTLEIVNQVISLPMHTELTDDQIDFITDTVKSFLG
ncbi:MAG: DegT/DnrJ/EryC1/StrS family aminotransferase [Flavobacteriaceae bacterium]|jgi:dTDP-4-amino-4,6-dideoxygalactose transaminase|nr:DegT/DnrJ/EryC1/StrS family aminotransferase [Flavobacteriaceae bacterium]MBT6128025.1 DegT/DnrJ/EryC1/StrS family aminotransferase [Flavobacteriaceae bacterium]MDG1028389.1 DegT/DnrJ/EryC1/StrS family aminotransferase [Flavobacteriaceae bacterium]MDG1942582.1 DegT/DnrJ/EryC1/StrS family aminotransferase [Flavobacteriaceae bacterium]